MYRRTSDDGLWSCGYAAVMQDSAESERNPPIPELSATALQATLQGARVLRPFFWMTSVLPIFGS